MQTQLQLEFLSSLKRSRARTNGFTLVELMIVVSVVGLLTAVALPRYAQSRNAARAGAIIGEQLGLAKECATWISSGGIGVNPSPTQCVGNEQTLVSRYGGCWGPEFGYGPVNSRLRCLGVTNGGGTGVVIHVAPITGDLSCTINGPRS
jgi:type IV pilus assembly protein PilA